MPRTAIEAKFLAQYHDERGVLVDNPYAIFEERDGDRVLIGGHHRFGTGPLGEKDVKLDVGQWVTLPDKGGPWFVNQCKKDGRKDIEFRIVPVIETPEDLQVAHPDLKKLSLSEYESSRAKEKEELEPVVPPLPKKQAKRANARG